MIYCLSLQHLNCGFIIAMAGLVRHLLVGCLLVQAIQVSLAGKCIRGLELMLFYSGQRSRLFDRTSRSLIRTKLQNVETDLNEISTVDWCIRMVKV